MGESLSASAYVQSKRLCILGIYDSPLGPIPFAHACACEAEDGPVNIHGELDPRVYSAIDKSQKAIMQRVQMEEVRLAAEELVDRGRKHDQNALGMMLMIRQNAMKGSPRAKLTMHYMLKYGKSNASMNGDGVAESARVIRVLQQQIQQDNPLQFRSAVLAMLPGMSMLEGGVTLANGPDLSADRIIEFINGLDDSQKRSFTFGFKHWKKTPDQQGLDEAACRLGRIFGMARTIQLVRRPNTPISTLSRAAGLELD